GRSRKIASKPSPRLRLAAGDIEVKLVRPRLHRYFERGLRVVIGGNLLMEGSDHDLSAVVKHGILGRGDAHEMFADGRALLGGGKGKLVASLRIGYGQAGAAFFLWLE